MRSSTNWKMWGQRGRVASKDRGETTDEGQKILGATPKHDVRRKEFCGCYYDSGRVNYNEKKITKEEEQKGRRRVLLLNIMKRKGSMGGNYHTGGEQKKKVKGEGKKQWAKRGGGKMLHGKGNKTGQGWQLTSYAAGKKKLRKGGLGGEWGDLRKKEELRNCGLVTPTPPCEK